MSFWDKFLKEDETLEKKEVISEKKPQEKISPMVERLDDLDILTKSIELAPKKLKIDFKPLISIRKLMAVREMFNLKAPKPVNKENLAKLLIKALSQEIK